MEELKKKFYNKIEKIDERRINKSSTWSNFRTAS